MQRFIEKFKNIGGKNGFYGFTPYTDGRGFSIKRDLNNKDSDNTSLLKFYIQDDDQEIKAKKSIRISATYGKKAGDGVSLRDFTKTISGPVDLLSKDEYYYDTSSDTLFSDKKEISPADLVVDIYSDHIKPTKPILGIWIRTKIFFWRVVLNKISGYTAKFFHYVLYAITGDKYSYGASLKEEVLNNKIISHASGDFIGRKKNRKMKDNLEESPKFDLLGYKTSRWVIIAYSILHLVLYVVLININFKPLILTTIFRNSFLTLIYVILSLWILETLVPKILKSFIRNSSKISVYSLHKTIKA